MNWEETNEWTSKCCEVAYRAGDAKGLSVLAQLGIQYAEATIKGHNLFSCWQSAIMYPSRPSVPYEEGYKQGRRKLIEGLRACNHSWPPWRRELKISTENWQSLLKELE